eukprot:scaffold2461_cov78-Skeletonema_dohrnii-CCMP3373.AAC.1
MSSSASSTRHLAEIVITAAESESKQKINEHSANIAQLRISNMKLHGRDEDIKLLRRKLRELAKKKEDDDEDTAKNHVSEMMTSNKPDPNKQLNNSNLILVSGTSGTGKSALLHKGLGDHAAKRGYTFVSGKFDEKLLRPLSAFSDAMSCLAKYITEEQNKMGMLWSGPSTATLIRDKVQNDFDEEDVEQLQRVLPGCAGLLGMRRSSLFCPSSVANAAVPLRSASGTKLGRVKKRISLVLAGKESISRIHYAVRRLLKIICSYLKAVVLFIDDLQWSDTATLDLLKSIVLDGDIPSLMIVGAFREDEVPE